MPVSALLPSIISAVGQGINALSTYSTNQASLNYNKEMYDRQRQDALADWTMQNEYNSPASQMARFKEAGLNPNLIYGQMTNSPVIRSQSVQSYSPDAIKTDLGAVAQTALQNYYDTKLKQAQINNLEAQNSVIAQEALLKSAQTLNIGTQQKKTDFDLGMAQTLKETSLQVAQQSLRKMEAETSKALSDVETQRVMRAPNLQKAIQEVNYMRKQSGRVDVEIDNLLKSGKLQDLDIQLKKNGIQPGDPMYLRMANQLLNDPKSTINSIKDWWKKLGK